MSDSNSVPHPRDRWTVSEPLRRRMVQAARELRLGATPSEDVLWSVLRRKAFTGVKFRRQQPIGPFVVDFLAPSRRLIIEIDGPIHENQLERDQERQAILEALGFRFLRFSAEQVEGDLDYVLKKIGDALRG